LALFFLTSTQLLSLLSPAAHVTSSAGVGAGLVPLALLGGAGLALADLGRREPFLELLPPASRIALQVVALAATALGAALLAAAGARWLAGSSLPLAAAPLAALQLAGLGVPLLAVRMPGPTRVGAFLALTWWVPALALPADGPAVHLRRALAPAVSDSASLGTMLPLASLAGAVLSCGILTARSLIRIR
jgi:hypothetical protein